MANPEAYEWQELRSVRELRDWAIPNHLLQRLIGKRCWKAGLTGPDELQLHWGVRRTLRDEDVHDRWRGSFVLSEAARWMLRTKSGRTIDSEDQATPRLKKAASLLIGSRTSSAAISHDGTLQLTFAEGPELQILLSEQGPPTKQWPVPDWELTFPEGSQLSVGPGPIWSLHHISISASSLLAHST
jgi:hypothetical protein